MSFRHEPLILMASGILVFGHPFVLLVCSTILVCMSLIIFSCRLVFIFFGAVFPATSAWAGVVFGPGFRWWCSWSVVCAFGQIDSIEGTPCSLVVIDFLSFGPSHVSCWFVLFSLDHPSLGWGFSRFQKDLDLHRTSTGLANVESCQRSQSI